MDNFGTGGVSDGTSFGRPDNAADADVVMSDRRFGSIREPADDEIAPGLRSSYGSAVGAHEGNAPAVRRWDESVAMVRLAPSGRRRAARCRNLPQIRFVHKINAVAVFVPERLANSAFGISREGDGRAAAISIRHVQVSDVGAVPDKGNALAVRRPDRVRRMLDFD